MSFALSYADHVRDGDFEDGAGIGTSNPAPDIGEWSDLQTPQLGKGATWIDGAGMVVVLVVRFDGVKTLDMVSLLDIRAAAPLIFSAIDYFAEGTLTQTEWYASPEPVVFPSDDFVTNLHYLGPSVQAEGLRITISTTATELYLGRLWAGPLWVPPKGIRRRWIQSVIDPGEMSISRGGQGYPRQRQRRRRLDIELSHMPYTHAFGDDAGSILDLQQIGFRVGITSPVIVLPRTRDRTGAIDTHAIHRIGLYGHFSTPLEIQNDAGNFFSARWTADELL